MKDQFYSVGVTIFAALLQIPLAQTPPTLPTTAEIQQIEEVKVEKVKPKKPLDVPRTPVAKVKPKPVQVTVSGNWVAQCHKWAAQAGISLPPAAIELIDRESDCEPCVVNGGVINCNYRGPKAFGIPQALPGSKTGCGSNPVCQLKWMKGYVFGRYGSWEAALRFHDQNNWY